MYPGVYLKPIISVKVQHREPTDPGDHHGRIDDDLINPPFHRIELFDQNRSLWLRLIKGFYMIHKEPNQKKHTCKPGYKSNNMDGFEKENGTHGYFFKSNIAREKRILSMQELH